MAKTDIGRQQEKYLYVSYYFFAFDDAVVGVNKYIPIYYGTIWYRDA